MELPVSPPLVTTAELAAHLRVTPCTVYRWRKRGCPVSIHMPNGDFRFVLADVIAWLGGTLPAQEIRSEPAEIVRARVQAEWARIALERGRRR